MARWVQMKNIHIRAVLLVLLVLLLPGAADRLAAQTDRPETQSRDIPLQQDPDMSVDHTPWNRLLSKYLIRCEPEEGPNRIDYGALSANPKDRTALKAYLEDLASVAVSKLKPDPQFAFWANLYNALTVDVVLSHYPARSIRTINISPGFFSTGPWGAKLITVESEKLSLDDIEHEILRPRWRDPRVHYALNCASIGCPNLAPKAYSPTTLEADLDAAARAYINSPRGVAVTKSGLRLSKIYDWYAEDFGDGQKGLLAHLTKYAGKALAQELANHPRIVRYDYDWALNDAAQK